MTERRVIVTVDGANLHLVFGKTYADWQTEYRDENDLWDFPLYELIDGSVEINEDIWYWCIGAGRCYETYEEV